MHGNAPLFRMDEVKREILKFSGTNRSPCIVQSFRSKHTRVRVETIGTEAEEDDGGKGEKKVITKKKGVEEKGDEGKMEEGKGEDTKEKLFLVVLVPVP